MNQKVYFIEIKAMVFLMLARVWKYMEMYCNREEPFRRYGITYLGQCVKLTYTQVKAVVVYSDLSYLSDMMIYVVRRSTC